MRDLDGLMLVSVVIAMNGGRVFLQTPNRMLGCLDARGLETIFSMRSSIELYYFYYDLRTTNIEQSGKSSFLGRHAT
jgi:hypothetical protein